jgi:hypothetical protein
MADFQKFKALVHYVCAQSPNLRSLGKTKLNKILWFSEKEIYLRTGKPISGVNFIKLPRGPVPDSIDEALTALEAERAIVVRDTEWNGRPKKEFINLREPIIDGIFTPVEISVINRAVMTICTRHTAQTISDLSHDEVWEAAKLGEVIPHYAVFGRPGELQAEDVQWAKSQLHSMQTAVAA